MHMRRFAHLLVDLVGRHGLPAQAEATFTGRSGATHTLPLALPCGPALVLVDGDLTGTPVDNHAIAALHAACLDLGATGLYLHSGPLAPSALLAAGSHLRFWSTDVLAATLGQTLVAEALGQPLPSLPFATPPFSASTLRSTALLLQDLEGQASDAARLVSEPDATVAAEEPQVPTPAPALPVLEVDLPASPAATVYELTEVEPAEPVATNVPVPGLDYIELADQTPVLHLEEADATVAAVEPAPAHATEAPDVIPLDSITPPEPEPALDVLAAPVFEVPAVDELMPPAFREARAPIEPVAVGLELPPVFASPEAETGNPLRAPDGSQGLLPPRITLDEAKGLVADRLFCIEEAELILQPVHLFDYAVDLLKPGKLTAAPVTGRLQVNGTDRRVAATDAQRCDPRLPHRVFADDGLTVMDKVLRVGPERAEQLATAWALEQHAKTVNVTTDRADDSFLVVERKSIAPTSGQVRLTPLGLWHRPFWRLWGANGHVDLDAVEGTVIDAEIKAPNPDFLLVE